MIDAVRTQILSEKGVLKFPNVALYHKVYNSVKNYLKNEKYFLNSHIKRNFASVFRYSFHNLLKNK